MAKCDSRRRRERVVSSIPARSIAGRRNETGVMKHHALRHHPIVVQHGRRHRRAIGAFEFCTNHFLLFPLGAVIALAWANMAPESYFQFAQSFGFLVNEVGMAFFFALIAQEVVEAVMPGG